MVSGLAIISQPPAGAPPPDADAHRGPMRSRGANLGATGANDSLRRVDEYGQATGDHAQMAD